MKKLIIRITYTILFIFVVGYAGNVDAADSLKQISKRTNTSVKTLKVVPKHVNRLLAEVSVKCGDSLFMMEKNGRLIEFKNWRLKYTYLPLSAANKANGVEVAAAACLYAELYRTAGKNRLWSHWHDMELAPEAMDKDATKYYMAGTIANNLLISRVNGQWIHSLANTSTVRGRPTLAETFEPWGARSCKDVKQLVADLEQVEQSLQTHLPGSWDVVCPPPRHRLTPPGLWVGRHKVTFKQDGSYTYPKAKRNMKGVRGKNVVRGGWTVDGATLEIARHDDAIVEEITNESFQLVRNKGAQHEIVCIGTKHTPSFLAEREAKQKRVAAAKALLRMKTRANIANAKNILPGTWDYKCSSGATGTLTYKRDGRYANSTTSRNRAKPRKKTGTFWTKGSALYFKADSGRLYIWNINEFISINGTFRYKVAGNNGKVCTAVKRKVDTKTQRERAALRVKFGQLQAALAKELPGNTWSYTCKNKETGTIRFGKDGSFSKLSAKGHKTGTWSYKKGSFRMNNNISGMGFNLDSSPPTTTLRFGNDDCTIIKLNATK